MLAYPQLGTGAVGQFPIQKRRQTRTVKNTAADGSCVKLVDPAGGVTEWRLDYADLTDGEIGVLEEFFTSAEGTLNGFVFLDPTANLLAWSGKLDEEVWERDALLTVEGGVSDPRGGTNAWRLSNRGAAGQTLAQTLTAPGEYVFSLSGYVRSARPAAVTLSIGEGRGERTISTDWSRVVFTGAGEPGAETVRFGIEVSAGDVVEVFGVQVEPQAGASAYRVSTRSGVYEGARLRDDELTVTATALNRHSCQVNIFHADHL
jgi:hypothetical protein